MTRFTPRLAAILVAIAIAGAALATAPRAAAEEYSDITLEAFVSAAIEVSRRIETWRPRIDGIADEDVREALIEDAQADIARAIDETEGIDEDAYHAIYDTAREDEALRGRIDRILATLSQHQGPPRAQ